MKRAPLSISFIVVIFLCLWSFKELPAVNAQQTLLNDNFTTDSSLNSSIWLKNGPSGTEYFERFRVGVLVSGGSSFDLVDPNSTFSGAGMSINGVDGPWKMTTIETVNVFSAPIALQASVEASKGGGVAFCMWLRDDSQPAAVGLCGVLNPSAPDYGIWSFRNSKLYNQRMLSSPQLNTVYQLSITINSGGEISLSLSSNGQLINSVSEQSIGNGPFKITLAQYEVWSDSTGIGPNQAYWKTVTATSNAPSNTPTPTPSPTTTLSPTASPTPTYGVTSTPSPTMPKDSPSASSTTSLTPPISATIPPLSPSNFSPVPTSETSIDPSSTVSITPSTVFTETPTSSPSLSASSEPTSPSSSEATLNLTTEVFALVIVASTIAAITLLFYRLKKSKKVTLLSSAEEKVVPSKLLLLGLLAAVFSIEIIDIFVPLLRPEIARTFGIGTATAFKIGAFSSIAGVLAGLVLSAISIKVRYKTLLLVGVLCTTMCTIGVFLAPNFLLMQMSYTLNGIGSVIVGVMVSALIGELYPQDKKAKRMSWVLATGQLATLIGSPVIGLIADTGGITGWRNALLWFQLPTTVICLLLVFVLVPNKSLPTHIAAKKKPFMNGFKKVLTNKSAVACLVYTFLGTSITAINSFAPAFVAEVFKVTPFIRSLIPIVAFSLLIAGLLIGGLTANRIGLKRLAVLAGLTGVIFSFVGFPISLIIPNVYVYLCFRFTAALIGGMALVAAPLLFLDQVPEYRGTMMSLVSASGGLGLASVLFLGSAILGFIDNPPIGYPVVTVVLGALGILSTFVIFFFAKDPIKDNPVPEK